MKKTIKFISTFILISILCTLTSLHIFASSYIVVDGFSYSGLPYGGGAIYDYDDRDADVIIPYKLNDSLITEIGSFAFHNDSAINSVSFAEATSLMKIGYSSFSYCTNLSSIELTTSINEVAPFAFQGCTALESVKFYANLLTIDEQTFYGCTVLDNVVLPNSLTSIGKYAFGDCSSLSKISIPDATKYIDPTAFYNCSNLTIRASFGSYAEQYAQEHNIPFEGIITHQLGDVDLDGFVNVKDVTEIQKHIADLVDLSSESLILADYNNDGNIDIIDATDIQKLIAEIN